MRILNVKTFDTVGPLHHVDVWFNSEIKMWTIQKMDANGFQIGEAEYSHTKAYATRLGTCYNVPAYVANRVDGKIKVLSPIHWG